MARTAEVLLGNGSSLSWRATSAPGVGTGSFVVIPSGRSIGLPQPDSEEVDTTDLDSEGDAKEYQLGDTDYGNSTIEVHWNPTNAQHAALLTALTAKTEHEFKAVIADSGKIITWFARVKGFPMSLSRNEPILLSMELRNTGAMTLDDA